MQQKNNFQESRKKFNPISKKIYELIKDLFPIHRSITGEGVRDSLKRIQKIIPINIYEVRSGKKVFDWVIPDEWNIRDAYVKDPKGKKILEFKKNNIHILSYSKPINKSVNLAELKKHLHYEVKKPSQVAYFTSYYRKDWGFSISYNQFKKLKKGNYKVVIDSSFKKGSLTYGEIFLKGKKKDEILLSSYLCHPSIANDSLSGVALLTYLASELKKIRTNYSYRFLFIPETIGSLTWLNKNQNKIDNIKGGLVATCLGDKGNSTYKKTIHGNSFIDKTVEKVLYDSKEKYNIVDFFPSGSDERIYSSPFFNIPVGVLMRTMYGTYPEYHTASDNLDIIKKESLLNSFIKYWEFIYILENNNSYLHLITKGEPQFGKRNIYPLIGGQAEEDLIVQAMRWIQYYSNGKNSLLDIAVLSQLSFRIIKQAANLLEMKSLIKALK